VTTPARQRRWVEKVHAAVRLPRSAQRVVDMALAVAAAEPADIEAAAHRLGRSHRLLVPLAWTGGALVLLVRGVKLLFVNWRLSLLQLLPAAWVWVLMWDLRHHELRVAAFRDVTAGGVVLLVALCVATTIAAFWCNGLFGFAIVEPPPNIRRAARRARPFARSLVGAGAVVGGVIAVGAIAIPRIDTRLGYLASAGALYALILVSFVAVPARILGLGRQKLPPREAVGRWAVGSALSAVAMTPGFVLDRIGLILIGISGVRWLGFVLLSVGTALYAAGMTSVRAVKLTMKLAS
jgi:hypothetical protein